MNDYQNNENYAEYSVIEEKYSNVSKKFFAKVFTWMFVALSLSAVTAFYFANTPSLLSYLVNFETGRRTILGWVAIFAPFGLVLLMSTAIRRLSYTALIGVFLLYSVLTGLMLSFVLLVYTSGSVIGCFVGAASIFAIMAILGYTTQIDLTKFGTILFIGLIGLILVSVVNMFLKSDGLGYILSFLGVAIFTGLTAYDVQKLKIISQSIVEENEDSNKAAVMGALSLYLDFINLFLYLLRIFGRQK